MTRVHLYHIKSERQTAQHQRTRDAATGSNVCKSKVCAFITFLAQQERSWCWRVRACRAASGSVGSVDRIRQIDLVCGDAWLTIQSENDVDPASLAMRESVKSNHISSKTLNHRSEVLGEVVALWVASATLL